MCWADGNDEKLKQYDFVFCISLKDASSDVAVEKLILEQHVSLRMNEVNPDEIKEVLKNNDGCKTLLLIDEYDQYQRCSNTSVDDAIEKRSLRNCQVLLSSRETQQVKNIRKYLDDEIELQGIDEANIEEYINGSLVEKSKGKKLLKRVEEILKLDREEEWIVNPTPLLVNMICISVMAEGPKPKSKTEAVPLADLGGGVRDARPPLGVQILSISCSFRENLACSRPPWRVHAPPLGKILDPPLSTGFS